MLPGAGGEPWLPVRLLLRKTRKGGWLLVHKTGVQQGDLGGWLSPSYRCPHSSHLFDLLSLSSSPSSSSLTTTSR